MKRLVVNDPLGKNKIRKEPPTPVSYVNNYMSVIEITRQIKLFLSTYYNDVYVMEIIRPIPHKVTYFSINGFAHFLKHVFMNAIEANATIEITANYIGDNFYFNLNYDTSSITEDIIEALTGIAKLSNFKYKITETKVSVILNTFDNNMYDVSSLNERPELLDTLRYVFTELSPTIEVEE